MKRTLLFILLFSPLLQIAVSASEKIDGIYYNLDKNEKTAEVAFGGYLGDIVIPSTVTKDDVEYTVTSIASNAFYNSPQMTSVTIPKSVTTIKFKREFFYNCNKLASIVVEEGNPKYDSREGCNALIETASNKLLYGTNNSFIPNSITTIGVAAFEKCNFTTLSIPNSVTTIEDDAFYGCPELTSVYIGTGLANFGEYVFYECDKLKKVEIHSNTLVSKNYTIEEMNVAGLFGGAPIEEIVLGEEVTSVGDRAFVRCNMNSIKMSDNLIRIGNKAFWECINLTSIEFSNNLEYIGEWAFAGCHALPSVIIPKSVKCIDAIAFQWCYALTKVVVNSNAVVSRENEQFYSMPSCFGKQVKEYVLGEKVTKIGDFAFYDSNELVSINIPSYVTNVGDSAFYNCNSMIDVYCYAEQVPETGKDVFVSSNYTNATLHVPAASLDAYRNAEQWKDFGNIVALEDLDFYRPFVEEGKVWTIKVIADSWPTTEEWTEYYYLEGDTIVNGQMAKRMLCDRTGSSQDVNGEYVGACYEQDKKVYYSRGYGRIQLDFEQLYDFTLSTGDSITKNGTILVVNKLFGGIPGFKGTYYDLYYNTVGGKERWLEGVGSESWPLNNHPRWANGNIGILLSCRIGDEVIYYNSEVEDPCDMGAKKQRFDFTHTVKTKPKAPKRREERLRVGERSSGTNGRWPKGKAMSEERREETSAMQSLYGEYNEQKLDINLDPLDDAYLVRITDETGKTVYEKAINAGAIVALNIDISSYAEGRYTVTVENSGESFTGIFDTNTTGIKENVTIGKLKDDRIYNLQGQRMSSLRRGVNIVNGRKVYVK